MLRPFVRTRDALRAPDFEALESLLLGSPLLGESTLGGTFLQTRGFAFTFTAAGRGQLEARFPALTPFLARAIDRDGPRKLVPWHSPWTKPPTPNAWYLNVLVVKGGGQVGRHLDATLQGPAESPGTTPVVVSVLYLRVPTGSGGELVLHAGPMEVARVQPKARTLLHFRGELAHEVTKVEGDGALRASLVLEQYAFAPEALKRLPALQLDSRAGFDAFLALHAQGPKRDFVLD